MVKPPEKSPVYRELTDVEHGGIPKRFWKKDPTLPTWDEAMTAAVELGLIPQEKEGDASALAELFNRRMKTIGQMDKEAKAGAEADESEAFFNAMVDDIEAGRRPPQEEIDKYPDLYEMALKKTGVTDEDMKADIEKVSAEDMDFAAGEHESFPLPDDMPGVGAARYRPEAADQGEEFHSGTSTVNAYTREMRNRLGMEQLPPHEAHKWEAAIDKANAIYDRDPSAPVALMNEVRQNPRPLSDTENMLLLRHTIEIQNRLNDAASRSHSGPEAEAEHAVLFNAMDAVYEFNEAVAGREAGRALNARKAVMTDAFTLVAMRYHKKMANGGTLTDAQAAEVKKAHEAIEALKKEVADAKAALDAAVKAKDAAEAKKGGIPYAEIRKTIQEVIADPAFKKRTFSGKMRSMGEKMRADAMARLRKAGGSMNAGINPERLLALTEYGAGTILEFGADFADWAGKMRSDFKDLTAADLDRIYWESLQKLRTVLAAEKPEAAGKKTDDAKELDRLTKAIDSIEERLRKGEFEPKKRKSTGRKESAEVEAARKKLAEAQKKFAKEQEKWRSRIKEQVQAPKKMMDIARKLIEDTKAKVPEPVVTRMTSLLEDASRIEDPAQRTLAYHDAMQEFLYYIPISKKAWFEAYIYSNMLSSPISHARNIVGNLTNALVVNPASMLANGDAKGALNYLTAALGEMFKGGAWKAAKDVFKTGELSHIMETIDNSDANMFLVAKRLKGPNAPAALAAWKTVTFIGRAMAAQDAYFGRMVEMGETSRLMAQGVKPDVALERGKKLAAKLMYRDRLNTPDASLDPITRSLERFGKWIDGARRDGGFGTFMKLTVPFLKTPVKIAELMVQTSPVGFVGVNQDRIAKAHYGVTIDEMKAKVAELNKAGTPESVASAKEIEDRIAEVEWTSKQRAGLAAVGTTLFALGMAAAAAGLTTWEPPEDEKEKELFYASGRRPYSVLINGKWVPMSYFGPAMLAFAAPTAFKRAFEKQAGKPNESLAQRLVEIGTAFPKMLADQLPLQGIAGIMDALQGKAYAAEKTLAGYASQITPAAGLLRYLEQIVDPTLQKPKFVSEQWMAGIPGLSSKVPTRTDAKGNPITQEPMYIAPYRTGTDKPEISAKVKDYPLRKLAYNASDPKATDAEKAAAVEAMRGVEWTKVRELAVEHKKSIPRTLRTGKKVEGKIGSKEWAERIYRLRRLWNEANGK